METNAAANRRCRPTKAPAPTATLPRYGPLRAAASRQAVSHRLRRPRGGRRPAPRPPAGVARPRSALVHPHPAGSQLRRPRPARHRVGPALLDQAQGRRPAGMAVRARGAPIPPRSLDTLPPAQVLLPHLGPLPPAVSARAAAAPHRPARLLPGLGTGIGGRRCDARCSCWPSCCRRPTRMPSVRWWCTCGRHKTATPRANSVNSCARRCRDREVIW